MSNLLLKPPKAAQYDLQFEEKIFRKQRDKHVTEQNISNCCCPESQPGFGPYSNNLGCTKEHFA